MCRSLPLPPPFAVCNVRSLGCSPSRLARAFVSISLSLPCTQAALHAKPSVAPCQLSRLHFAAKLMLFAACPARRRRRYKSSWQRCQETRTIRAACAFGSSRLAVAGWARLLPCSVAVAVVVLLLSLCCCCRCVVAAASTDFFCICAASPWRQFQLRMCACVCLSVCVWIYVCVCWCCSESKQATGTPESRNPSSNSAQQLRQPQPDWRL